MHERRFHSEIERLRSPERLARLEVERVIALSLEGLNQVKAILDIGTGSGVFAEQFAALGPAVTGLDANPEILAVAHQFVPAASFKEGVAEKLPFENGSFDLVFMGLVLHETDDLSLAIREARRVTRKRLAILEWPDEEQPFGPPREHRLPAGRVRDLAQAAGFLKIDAVRLESLVLYRADL